MAQKLHLEPLPSPSSSSKPPGPRQETELPFGTKHPHSPRLRSTLLSPSAVFTFTPAPESRHPPSARAAPEATVRLGPSTTGVVPPADPCPSPPAHLPPQQSTLQAAVALRLERRQSCKAIALEDVQEWNPPGEQPGTAETSRCLGRLCLTCSFC